MPVKTDIFLIGEIIKKRAESISDAAISTSLKEKGYAIAQIKFALDAIDKDIILVIYSIPVFTPISPIIYRIGVRKIEKETRVFWGLFKNTLEVAIKTIDKVNLQKGLFRAKVGIVHSQKSQIIIDNITRKDAERIREMYAHVIEAQRKNIINIAED